MRTRLGKSGLIAMITATIFAAGCAPMTEAQRTAREYSRIDFQNRFVEARTRCTATGRRIVITSYGGGVDGNGIPRSRVSYICT